MVAMAVRQDYRGDVLRAEPHFADRCRMVGRLILLAAISCRNSMWDPKWPTQNGRRL